MALPPDFVRKLTCPHPSVLVQRVAAGKRLPRVAIWAWRAEIAPVDLYCYLWARFGPPNGLQNFLRSDDSDNLIHWEWELDHPEGHIHIQGMNFRTEVLVLGSLPVAENDRLALATLLKNDFSDHHARIAEIRRGLEHWIEFVNPYQRLRAAVEKLLQELRALGLQPETQKVPDITSVSDFQPERWEQVVAGYTKGFGLCFGIRSMLPVMAEAYVNFLLFLLMRRELKDDQRLRENAFRQPIDIRVKSLHMNCHGFEKSVDYASPECKAYHSLVNERNDLLHGNVVMEKLRFNEVYFNDRVPIFKAYRSMWERTVGVDIEAVGLHRLESEVETVNNFIAYLSSCLKADIKPLVEMTAARRDLGRNSEDGRIGILFGDFLVDAILDRAGEAPLESEE